MKSWDKVQLWNGDCLTLMDQIEDNSIDLILTDLPYGTTDCSWDKKLNLDVFWKQCKRTITNKGCIALTSSQPFTTDLINSNREMFRYCWTWNKGKGGNIMSCAYQPYKIHEDIIIFSKSGASKSKNGNSMNYFPIMEPMKNKRIGKNYNKSNIFATSKTVTGYSKEYTHTYPKSIINISNAKQEGKIHPTQKPVELFKYLIETYTLPEMKVLDPCCGSGSCLVASYQLGRECIGIEIDEKYYNLIRKRMDSFSSLSETSR